VTEPAARARVDGRHNIIVQAIGSGINVAVDARIPYLRLTQFEARTKRAGADGSDAALLKASRPKPPRCLPALAMSLGAQGRALAYAERHADAAGASREGLAVIAPFVERHAQAFGNLARGLGRGYIAACKKVGTVPDIALLERVARALGGGADTDEASVEALKAKIDAILDAAGKTGALDEDALAELPSRLAEQLRAAWTAARSGLGTENPGG
jgi:hypothetical protein